MGYSPHIAPQATNCAAPDTGNMGTQFSSGSSASRSDSLLPSRRGLCSIRQRRAAEKVLDASVERRDSKQLCHDGIRGCVLWMLRSRQIQLTACMRTVASSDATNLRGTIRKEGNKVIVNARKWVRFSQPPLGPEAESVAHISSCYTCSGSLVLEIPGTRFIS
jgi:acyl-CoA dehydrogenase